MDGTVLDGATDLVANEGSLLPGVVRKMIQSSVSGSLQQNCPLVTVLLYDHIDMEKDTALGVTRPI